MPPKRLRRHSPSNAGIGIGERLKRAKLAGSEYSAWGWVGTEVTDASEISQNHRLATCGFSRNSAFPLCANKYSGTLGPESTPQEPKEAAGQGELEDDIIVVSDDETPSCSHKSCRSNPYCINYLGQEKWEDEDKSRAAFLRQARIGENPIYRARDPGLPVGLKNLGATCYANAFLQVWFQDLAFCSGVYQCLPSPETGHKFEESPIFQLQVTFAAMQESTQNAFNPIKLVESLRLRTTEQQDAQEFSKLFMAHLDSEFQKQSVPGLKSLLADQFQGKQVYGTHCSGCNNRSERESEFLEVEVNIPRHNAKLEDRLSALLQPEELSGDNKYFCSICNGLQDAKRYTEFRQLPPVLHISLLRFVFDLQSMERKKSKNAISFPLVLDMDPFIGSPENRSAPQEGNSPGRNLYHLRGVLLHKGPSAYHGHYEAQVFDIQNQSWYQFNDETVTKMDALGSVLKNASGKDDSQRSVAHNKEGSQRGRPRKKTRIDDSDVEIIETLPKSEEESTTEQNYVSSKDAYMLVYAKVPVSEEDVTVAGSSVDKATSAANGTPANGLIPTETLVPPSRALDVVNALNADYDRACDEYAQKEKEVKHRFEEKRRMVMDIYRSWSLSSYDEGSAVVSRQALESWLTRYIAKPSKPTEESKESKQAVQVASCNGDTVYAISNADIICVHEKLDPNKSANMKRIRQEAAQRIMVEDECRLAPMLEPADICERCTDDIFHERLYQVQHPQIVSRFDEVSQVEEHEAAYWISKAWLKDWRLIKPKMHEPSKPDPSPSSPEFASHVTCEHGGLTTNTATRKRISVEGYSILKELLPDWDTLSSDLEVCPVCEALVHISREDKREVRKQAEDEKARLKHMYDMAVMDFTTPLENVPCAIIPARFLRSWKQWLIRPTEVPRPEGVDNTQFICRHGHLILDPNVVGDLENDIAVIRRRDYDVLEDLYTCGPLIGVENNGDNITHALPVCADCRVERKSKFETAEVTVRILKPSDPIPTPESFSSKDITPWEPRGGPPITYGSRKVNGVRQSKRIRQVRAQGKRRKMVITQDMTVKDLKIEVQNDLGIPTIYQRLFHQGRELEENAATLVSSGIMANDMLDLREEAEDVDMVVSGSEDDRARPEEGRAFGGTLLSGGQTLVESSTSGGDTPDSSQKTCPACTFSNPPDVLACTMCDTIFYTDS